jgi:hypothetical protein
MTDTFPFRTSRRDAAAGKEDRLEVLRMLESGAITADEAARLLDALDRTERIPPFSPPNQEAAPGATAGGRERATIVRIRVTDAASGRARVNLALPLSLVDTGLNVVRRFAPDRLTEAERIRQLIFSGIRGQIVDIEGKTGERVQVIIE